MICGDIGSSRISCYIVKEYTNVDIELIKNEFNLNDNKQMKELIERNTNEGNFEKLIKSGNISEVFKKEKSLNIFYAKKMKIKIEPEHSEIAFHNA